MSDPFGDDQVQRQLLQMPVVYEEEKMFKIESCAFPSTVAGTVGTGQGNGWDGTKPEFTYRTLQSVLTSLEKIFLSLEEKLLIIAHLIFQLK